LLIRATYMNGVVLHAHPARGESHIQRNTTGEVATVVYPHGYLKFLINVWQKVNFPIF